MTRPAPFTPERQLPDGSEIDSMRQGKPGFPPMTFAEIGERYGVTRQAAHKAWRTWQRKKEEAKAQVKDVPKES